MNKEVVLGLVILSVVLYLRFKNSKYNIMSKPREITELEKKIEEQARKVGLSEDEFNKAMDDYNDIKSKYSNGKNRNDH
jgi:hypothetical protein